MGPKPGQIRCPTCHRSTTPAAYCTHCGSPIADSARVRPRGLDRDELQERIRARRSGPMPFRRGSGGDEEGWQAPPGVERYAPEPEDERRRRRRAAAAGAEASVARAAADEHRVDNTAPDFDAQADARRRAEEEAAVVAAASAAGRDEPSADVGDGSGGRAAEPPADEDAGDDAGSAHGGGRAATGGAVAAAASPFRRGRDTAEGGGDPAAGVAAPVEPPPGDVPPPAAASASSRRREPAAAAGTPVVAASGHAMPEPDSVNAEPEHLDRFDDEAYDQPDPRYYYESEERGDGIGVGAVLGIAALGVLALFVGVMLAGVFGDDGGTARVTPTPTAQVIVPSGAPSGPASASAVATGDASGTPAPSATASDGSVTFPDGFVAEAQPCANPPNSPDCGSSGARNNGNVWIVVSFRNGTSSDVVSVAVEQADGSVLGSGSLELADINCAASCQGYTYFAFQNLDDGTYTVSVTRNGEPAGETGFTVQR